MIERRYINEKDVSRFMGKSVMALRMDRHKRQGLPYHKVGKRVFYDREEIIQYMDEHRIQPED